MFIVWLVLSVFISLIVIETSVSLWINSGTRQEKVENKLFFKNIQWKFLKKKAV
ncbi:hypothetical protein [Peribacillus asahii]|uniref:hypothetical protein n=1 Tax=Peribacillus asahii TaxID=228899 RepID=UPI0015FDD880|nr:hypothetical protein [Peribacillus asahii]